MQADSNPFSEISLEDIIDSCGKNFTTRGQAYWRNQQVLELEWDPDAAQLTAKVAGSNALPYSQTIRAQDDYIDGNCSCPVGYNCKHVAAVLFEWMSKTAIDPGTPNAISKHIENWRDKILRASNAQSTQSDNTVFPGEEMLLYVLASGPRYNSQPGINVEVIKTRLLKKGGYGKESVYRYQSDYLFPRWMSALDKEIINIALACRDRYNYKPLSLEGNLGIPLLKKLLQTNRCYWDNERETALQSGPARELKLEWTHNIEDDKYTLQATLNNINSTWHLIPCTEPWYIDTESMRIGTIQCSINGSMLYELLQAPAQTNEQAQETANFFALHMPNEKLPMPMPAAFESVSSKPIPVLCLQSLQSNNGIADYFLSIHFRYDEYQLPFSGTDAGMVEKKNTEGADVVIRRDLTAELDHLVFFNKHCPGFAPADNWDTAQFTSADRMPRPGKLHAVAAEWRAFLEVKDIFIEAGWEIDQRSSFDLSFETVSDVSAHIGKDMDGWFDISLTISHKSQQFDLVPLVSDWLEMGQPHRPMMVLSDEGGWFQVAPEVLEPVVKILMELFDKSPGDKELVLPRQAANIIEDIEHGFEEKGVNLTFHGDTTLLRLGQEINAIRDKPPPKPPGGLKAELREYQLRGLGWLQFLHSHGFNGLLADDMGLGKTLQTLSHLLMEHNAKRMKNPALIVAPTSVLGNWRNEAKKFTPRLKTLVLHGSDRHSDFQTIGKHHIVITSYQLLLRDIEMFQQCAFDYLILDEAQMIKNPQAKVSQAAKSLPIDKRLCLTGTPMENHLGELWSLFDFLMPGFLGSRKQFTQLYRTPIEKHGDLEKQKRLSKVISAFLLRRSKDQVAKELPPKTIIVREVELGTRQSQLYESIRLSMEQRVRDLISQKGLKRSHIEILEALLKLRQTCCHPGLVKLDNAKSIKESAKTDMLLDMIQELIAEKKKILLFSQFTEMLKLIQTELKKLDIDFVTLTGETKKRQKIIDQFQNEDIPLFLISLKAGGTGLNLSTADTVIHYDPWWNPAVENQASDRAHRIGQQKPVFVYKLVAKDTVEEKIMIMQQKKQELADGTYNRKEMSEPLKQLDPDDLLSLFTLAEKR